MKVTLFEGEENKKFQKRLFIYIIMILILISLIIITHRINEETSHENIENVENVEFNTDQKTNISQNIVYLQPKIDPNVNKLISRSIYKYSNEYKIPSNLIIAIIFRESSFKLLSSSKANCKGLMQINAEMHTEKLEQLNIQKESIFHIDNNIHLGCWILNEYLNQTNDINKALIKYVGGEQTEYIIDILILFTNLELMKQKGEN